MRIAVCYSGQLRMGIQALANQKVFFGKLLPHIDFFVHTWDINTNKRYHNFEQHIPAPMFDAYFDLIKPKAWKVDEFAQFKAAWDHRIQPLYTSWRRSILLKQEFEKANNFKYDIVVKLRPDIIFKTGRNLEMHVTKAINEYSFLCENIELDDAWKSQPFNDDVMWIAPNDLMDFAISFTENRNDTEILLSYLDRHCISVKSTHFAHGTNDRGYSIYRDECQHLDPIKEYEECHVCEYKFFCDTSKFYQPYTISQFTTS